MKVGSLFTGYGGLDRSARAVFGGELAWVSDNHPSAVKLLAHRYPDVPNLGDITAIDWEQVERVALLCAGFPCTDISNAGGRAGIEGEHSGLWFYVVTAIRVLRPRHVLLENVSALLVRGLDRVAADLATLGYDLRWVCLRASDVGAPHRRERWFGYAVPSVARGVTPNSARDGRDEGRAESAGLVWGPDASVSGAPVQDSHGTTGGERRLAAPGQAESGRARSDAGGRGGASSSDSNSAGPQGAEPARGHDLPARGTTADPDSGGQPWDSKRGGGPQREEAHDKLGLDADGHVLDWGQFEPAIRRWEAILGRPAPEPTEPGRNGNRVLSPRFVEHMMGVPGGWVTDVPGLSRAEMLRLLGNGVVQQQGEAALRWLVGQSGLWEAA